MEGAACLPLVVSLRLAASVIAAAHNCMRMWIVCVCVCVCLSVAVHNCCLLHSLRTRTLPVCADRDALPMPPPMGACFACVCTMVTSQV